MFEISNALDLKRYPDAIALIDEEFVYSKGRSISLAKRMPFAYGEQNAGNIYCALEKNKIVGVLTARRFGTEVLGKTAVGYMIGGVVTEKMSRNQGVASQLLRYIENVLLDADFFILWTGIPVFYKRIGWQDSARGIFGRFEKRPISLHPEENQNAVLQTPSLENIEIANRFFSSHNLSWLYENSIDRYHNIPLPVEQVMIATTFDKSGNPQACSSIGIKEHTAYIYDLAGTTPAMQDILNYLVTIFSVVFFNAHNSSEAGFRKMGAFDIAPGPHALIKSRSATFPVEHFQALYIPYLDRI